MRNIFSKCENEIRAQMEKLFTDWKEEQRTDENYENNSNAKLVAKESFGEDGAVDYEKWQSRKGLRILYVLKESNGVHRKQEDSLHNQEGSFWFREVVESGKSGGKLVNRIWSMQKQFLKELPAGEVLKYCALLNLNKRGGGAESGDCRYEVYAEDYKEFIKREIEILSPDIVVCGGTYDIVKKLYGQEDSIWETKEEPKLKYFCRKCSDWESVFFPVYHPSYSYINNEEYFRLANVEEMLRCRESVLLKEKLPD